MSENNHVRQACLARLICLTRLLRPGRVPFLTALPAACAVVMLLPFPAWAGPDMSMRMADRFEQMDANGNDKVTREEFTEFFPDIRDSTFELIDADGDGFIDRAEWLEFKTGHAKGMNGGQGGGMPPAGMGPGKKGPGAAGGSGGAHGQQGGNPGALLPGIQSGQDGKAQ